MVPEVNLDQVRRELVAEHGIRIEDDDPMLIVFAIAERTMRRVIEAERAKRADENLLTYKDVRHVLEDVRNDSLQFSQEIVGLALDQISKVVIAELAEERRTKAAIINTLKIWLAASFGFAVAAMVF